MGFKLLLALVVSTFVAACSTGYKEPPPIPPQPGDEAVKIGAPYEINGVTYYPREDLYYDVTGYASWYGDDFHGQPTANGEIYDMNALTAAHTTLPMPSYVRVTNLANGRSLVVRINDRGPFLKERVIDLSRRTAQLLGFEDKGVERVRVQAVRPDGTPYPMPVDGGLIPLPERTAELDIVEIQLDTLPGSNDEIVALAEPELAVVEKAPEIYIQVASFSYQENARLLSNKLQGLGPVLIQRVRVNDAWFYRVQVGAFADMTAALAALGQVKNLGYLDAHVFTDPLTLE